MGSTPNWISNFAPVCQHSFMGLDNSTNIDDLFQKEEDSSVIKMIELKGEVLSLIQGKEEFDLLKEEQKEIKEEGEKKETITELSELIQKIQTYIDKFNSIQKELNECNKNFQSEVTLLKKNVSTIETMIDFIKKIPNDQKNQENMKTIIDQMNKLSKTIMDNKNIKKIRKEYVQKRKEAEKIIQLIKKVNNLNHCNVCPLCFTNPVDHFTDPCGHTFCKECIQKTLQEDGPEINLYEIGRNKEVQCCFCRERIKRPLYFL